MKSFKVNLKVGVLLAAVVLESSCGGSNAGQLNSNSQNQGPEITPTVTLSDPSTVGPINSAGVVLYTLAYEHVSSVTFNLSNIHFLNSGSVSCIITVSSPSDYVRDLRISSCAGEGSFSFSIDSGTAVDELGRLTPSVKATQPIAVTQMGLILDIDNSGLGASPSNDPHSRTIVFGGTNIVQYKAVLLEASNCSHADFRTGPGILVYSISTPFQFIPRRTVPNIVCAIGGDASGNWQQVPTASAVLVIDLVAPVASIDSAGLFVLPSNDLSARTVSIAGSGVAAYKAVVLHATSCDGANFSNAVEFIVSTGFEFIPESGPNIVCTKGRDEAGNWQTTVTSSEILEIN